MSFEDFVSLVGAAASVVAAFAGLLTATGTFLLAYFAYRAWSVASATLEAARQSALAGREAAEQSRLTVLQMRSDSETMREDSARNSRPYVYAELVPSLWGVGHWDVVIQNLGRSIARNVELSLIDEMPDDVIGRNLQGVTERLFTLAPSARLRFSWRTSLKGHEAGMDGKIPVQIDYYDDNGEPYHEDVILDTSVLGDAFPAPTVGAKVDKGTDEESLKNVRLALEALNTHVGELRR